jgi:hypothetical protein
MIVFIYKWLKNAVFRRERLVSLADLRRARSGDRVWDALQVRFLSVLSLSWQITVPSLSWQITQ